MPNVLLTKQGMDFILSAHDDGVFINIAFFVPVYDDRIDSTLRDSIVLSSNSQIADPTRTTPFGEIIWNSNGYSLDSRSQYIISAGSFSGTQLQNSYQNSTKLTNLYNLTPLSPQVSANSWTSSGGTTKGTYNWYTTTGVGYTGSNSRPNNTSSDFWKVADYYPVYDTSAEHNLRGSFKCIINNSIGTFKFNKIALYAVAVQNGVVINGSNPTFFGEAYLGTPAVVSNVGIGYSQFEYDIQIDVSGTSANWEDVFFSSSADYWTHSPGGLYFPGKIGVGQFQQNQNAISATVHARKPRTADGTIDSLPLLRLEYENYKYISLDVDGNQFDLTQRVLSSTHYGTDLIIDVANWQTYCGDAISIHPKIKDTVVLGTSTEPFRELYLANYLVNNVGHKNLDYIIPLHVTNIGKNYAVDINNGSVYLGISVGAGGAIADDPFGIRMNGIGVDITDDKETVSSFLHGSFKGGDLLRHGQNLLVYNSCENVSDYYNIGQYVENIYFFAGLDISATYRSVDGQVGATHKNIVYEIENEDTDGRTMFCSLKTTHLSNNAEIQIAAKGKLGLFGPVELRNINNNSKNTAILLSRSKLYSGDVLGDKRLFIGAGIKTTTNFDTISNIVDDIENGVNNNFSSILNSESSLYLIAKKVIVESHFYPNVDNTYFSGLSANRWYATFSNIGFFGNTTQTPSKGLQIGDIWNYANNTSMGEDSTITYGIIKLGNNSNDTKAQIGQADDPFNYGFFQNIGSYQYKTDRIFAKYIGLPNDNGVVNYGYFGSLSTSYMEAGDGYYERNRRTKLGEWITCSFKNIIIELLPAINLITSNAKGKFSLKVRGTSTLGSSIGSGLSQYIIRYTLIGKTIIFNGWLDFYNSNAPMTMEYIRIFDLRDVFTDSLFNVGIGRSMIFQNYIGDSGSVKRNLNCYYDNNDGGKIIIRPYSENSSGVRTNASITFPKETECHVIFNIALEMY